MYDPNSFWGRTMTTLLRIVAWAMLFFLIAFSVGIGHDRGPSGFGEGTAYLLSQDGDLSLYLQAILFGFLFISIFGLPFFFLVGYYAWKGSETTHSRAVLWFLLGVVVQVVLLPPFMSESSGLIVVGSLIIGTPLNIILGVAYGALRRLLDTRPSLDFWLSWAVIAITLIVICVVFVNGRAVANDCSTIADPYLRDPCYKKLAQKTGDFSYCEFLTFKDGIDECVRMGIVGRTDSCIIQDGVIMQGGVAFKDHCGGGVVNYTCENGVLSEHYTSCGDAYCVDARCVATLDVGYRGDADGYTCSDADGFDPYLRSSVSGVNSIPYEEQDFCYTDRFVTELGCDRALPIRYIEYCEGGCRAGACVPWDGGPEITMELGDADLALLRPGEGRILSWSSVGARECTIIGGPVPLTEGGIWIDGVFTAVDGGAWASGASIPLSGEVSVHFMTNTSVEIRCVDDNGAEARDGVFVLVRDCSPQYDCPRDLFPRMKV